MSQFDLFFHLGLKHILNIDAADHLLFLLALTAIFKLKDWKHLLAMVSLFTVSHTLSLAASAYGWVKTSDYWVELGIVLTIIITALSNLFVKNHKTAVQWHLTFAFLFGLIHGMGFAHAFLMISQGYKSKLYSLLVFALGVETGQVIVIVLIVAVLSIVFRRLLKTGEKTLTVGSVFFILGYSLSLLIDRI